MNDKIQITTKEFQKNDKKFKDNFENDTINFLKTQNLDNLNTEILSNAYENNKKIWYNGENLNVNINPKGLQIIFNPNRLMGIKPANILEYEKWYESFEIIESNLYDIGIELNIKDKPIYRHHTSYDLETDKPFPNYNGLLKMFMPHSTKTRYNDKFSIDTTLYKEISKNQKVVCYDKTKLYNKMNPEHILETNVMRIEYRNENVPKLLRLSLNNINKDRYYKIRTYHKEIVKQNLFNVNILETDSILSLFSELILNKINRTEMYKYISSYSINKELNNNGLILKDVISSLVDSTDENYKRYLRYLIKDFNSHSVFETACTNELYTEILYKFNKVA